MRPAASRLLARMLFVATLVLVGVGLSFLVRSLDQPTTAFGFRGATALLTLSFSSVAVLLASRRPDNPIGWILLVAGLASAVQMIAQEYATYALAGGDQRGAAVANWIDSWIWVPITGSVGIHVFLLFPTGRPPSPRWRWVRWVGTAGILVFGGAFLFATDTELGLRNPLVSVDVAVTEALVGPGAALYMIGLLGAVTSLIVRFRRSSGDERQQLRWFAAAASMVALILPLVFVDQFVLGADSLMGRIGGVGLVLAFAAIPVATGVAILKYRLYDLDVVISRAVLYAGLVAIITLFYVAVVVGIGALIGSQGNLFLSVVATAIVALAFHPLRERVRRFANRLVYGKRATPYEVLSEFSEGLGRTVYSTEEVLPRLARLLGEGTGGETGVWVHIGDQLRLAASWPAVRATGVPAGTDEVPGWDRTYPVRHRGDLLGALTISKQPAEPLTASEERLIGDVASQAGLVLGNVRLIEELRASRQRIVAAQDEERRRLERNIHDGAQQQLVAMAVKLRLARTMAAKDAEKAQALLDQLQAENQETLETLRDLARGIYPPLLADRGLAAALEAQARKSPIPVAVEADGTGRYAQEVEAAAYFSVLEALQNVAKYANATTARVRLWAEPGELGFAVEDDGTGFDPARTPRGPGLRNIADRLDSLGGSVSVRSAPGAGTEVTGRIPAQPAAAAQASDSRSGSSSDLGM